jgi:hypothetical protein
MHINRKPRAAMSTVGALFMSLKPDLVSAVTDNGGLKSFIEGQEMRYQYGVNAKHQISVLQRAQLMAY